MLVSVNELIGRHRDEVPNAERGKLRHFRHRRTDQSPGHERGDRGRSRRKRGQGILRGRGRNTKNWPRIRLLNRRKSPATFRRSCGTIASAVEASAEAGAAFDATRDMIKEVDQLESSVKMSMVEQNEGSPSDSRSPVGAQVDNGRSPQRFRKKMSSGAREILFRTRTAFQYYRGDQRRHERAHARLRRD